MSSLKQNDQDQDKIEYELDENLGPYADPVLPGQVP